MKIAGRLIGEGQPPYIVAEVGCNHGGSLTHAIEMIDAAKSCGADACKFQCYEADTITIESNRPEFQINGGLWNGRNLHDLYQDAETPFAWFPELKARADKVGIAWMASVFDKSSVDLMVSLDAPAIKIASFEIVDLPLIRYAASTGLPLIISTGMASTEEIVEATLAAGGHNFALLHCVSGYPTNIADANLMCMRGLFNLLSFRGMAPRVGISDHTMSIEVPIAATALGASIIEKHFRLSWHADTEDSAFSLDEADFFEMAKRVRNTWSAMQPPKGDPEVTQRPMRRSLFAVREIKEGEMFTEENVRSIRPGHGLPPKEIGSILGRPAARHIERGEPMTWEMISQDAEALSAPPLAHRAFRSG